MDNAKRSQDRNLPTMTSGALSIAAGLVRAMGCDPKPLFAEANIPETVFTDLEMMIPVHNYATLLQLAASRLSCASFGLQVAKLYGGHSSLRALDLAMQNSSSLEEAFQICANYSPAYGSAIHFSLYQESGSSRSIIGYDVKFADAERYEQIVELGIAWIHLSVLNLSRNRARAVEIWFAHQPVAPLGTYRAFFGTKVVFGKPINAVVVTAKNMKLPLGERDNFMYELARSYAETHYPRTADTINRLAWNAIRQILASGACSYIDVAEMLGMHPRTFQRRLRESGTTFEKVKDEVRRELAFRWLTQTSIPFDDITSALGYSQATVLSRSCQRWFGRSPRAIRRSEGRPEDGSRTNQTRSPAMRMAILSSDALLP